MQIFAKINRCKDKIDHIDGTEVIFRTASLIAGIESKEQTTKKISVWHDEI